MRIIEEPVHNSLQNIANNYYSAQRGKVSNHVNEQVRLRAKYRAANFSGPGQLEQLNGKCFEHVSLKYKWIVCPFQNVTQFEDEIKWNSYKGLLGVWFDWRIENETFTGMRMLNGEACGADGAREVTLQFVCDQNAELDVKIGEISEPKTCKYNIKLNTSLICEKYSMNVYAHLSSDLKHEWDLVYSELQAGLVTEKVIGRVLIFTDVYVYT